MYKDFTQLLRLADINISTKNSGKTGGLLLPFDNTSDLPHVKTISMAKWEANPNELCIWEWTILPDDPGKQYSTRSDLTFYELIFLNNGLTIDPLPIWDLFDTLIDGFIVPLHHSKSFLLVINQTETEYICLDITESSYSCNGNKIKIHESTPLKEYKISKADVIDTDEYVHNLGASRYSLDPALQHRIIYKRRTIWINPIATLPLKRFNKHLAEYLEQVVTRFSGLTGNKRVIETFIKSVTDDVKPNSDLMTFLGEYYSQPKKDSFVPILEKYPQLELIFTSYFKRTSTDEKFLELVVEQLPSTREKYLKVLTEHYLEEEKQKILDQLVPLQSYIEKEKQKMLNQLIPLQTQIEELSNDIKEKNILKQELSAKINSLTTIQMELIAQIKENEQLRQELDELVNGKRTGLLQELTILKKIFQLDKTTFETPTQNTNASVLTIRPGNCLEFDKDPTEIARLSCMYSLLQGNLPEQGTDKPDLLDLSKFISASYLCHFPILCVGTSAGDMARIIAISLNNQLPDSICVPTGYNNYSFLLNTIRNLKSEIVVLENIVGYCDEYCYTHLAEDIPEKYIIFLIEYEETLNILPKSIYAHMGLIHCDEFFMTELMSDERPDSGKITGSISYLPDIDTRRELFDNILRLTQGFPVSFGYINSRVKVLQAITQSRDNIAEVLKVISTELKSIVKIYGISEKYKDQLLNSKDPIAKNFIDILGVETE